MTIVDLVRTRAKGSPGLIAIAMVGGPSISYRELDLESNAAARGFVRRGIREGDLVAVLSEGQHWVEYVILYFAIQKAGGVCVPLQSHMTDEELKQVLAPLRVRLVSVPSDDYRCPDGWDVITLDCLRTGESREPFPVRARADGIAHVLHTSGTMGQPKPIPMYHAETPVPRTQPLRSQRFVLQAFHPATSVGTVGVMLSHLGSGVGILAQPHFEVEQFVLAAQTQRPELAVLSPTMAELLMRRTWPAAAMSSLRVVWLTGARSSPQLLKKISAGLPRAKVINVYGLTEAPGVSTHMPVDLRRPEAIGRPGLGGTVRIVDDQGAALGPGAVGEIELLRSGGTGPYWVRTADLGRLDSEGYLYYEGRLDNIVVVGDRNVSVLEVEDALRAHPAVREACVIGVPAPLLGHELVAVVSVDDANIPAAALRQFLWGRLSSYKVPGRFVVVDRIPTNSIGKVRRSRVRDDVLGARWSDEDGG